MNLPLPTNLIGTGLALLAFVVAFYVLLARERKTPYIINFIFQPAGLLLVGILFAFAAQFAQLKQSPADHASFSSSMVMKVITWGAVGCFSAGLVLTLVNFWRLHNRQVHFRDDSAFKNTRLFRWVKRKMRQFSDKQAYQQTEVAINSDDISKALSCWGEVEQGSSKNACIRTFAVCGKPLKETTPLLVKTCIELLSAGWCVQYTTCIRHPWELTELLKSGLAGKWNESKEWIVIVDAYTPHFGFTDSVHEDKTVLIRKSGVNYVAARESYAGVHTAAAKGFNTFKKLDNKQRRPTIVIYEGANALADLESLDQYRIFARHVLSSERMWGGMLTLFIEPTVASNEMKLLRTYADIFVAATEVTSG